MSKLFEEIKIGPLKLNNRIIIAPMCQYSAINGAASSWHTIHYGQLSHSGAGLLILEATAVEPRGRISWGDLGLYSDECEKNLKEVLKNIRTYSSMPLAIQLAHAGRKASCEKPWFGGSQISPNKENGWETVAPSPVAFSEGQVAPKELSHENLKYIKESFVQSAMRAVRLGFDGIEIHAAHGYLLHQFLSPLSNFRKDSYGGSLENRMKFPLEVFKAVKEVLPKSMALWIRISATDWMNQGWNESEAILFCKELEKLGCQAIHVSSGGLDPKQQIPVQPMYQIEFANKIKKEIQIPVIGVGMITEPEQAEMIIQEQKADMVAIARAILYNPRWPWHAAQKLKAKVKCPPQYLRSEPQGVRNLLERDL